MDEIQKKTIEVLEAQKVLNQKNFELAQLDLENRINQLTQK